METPTNATAIPYAVSVTASAPRRMFTPARWTIERAVPGDTPGYYRIARVGEPFRAGLGSAIAACQAAFDKVRNDYPKGTFFMVVDLGTTRMHYRTDKGLL